MPEIDKPLPLDCVHDKEALLKVIERAKFGGPFYCISGIDWSKTPQGEDYWVALSYRSLGTSDIAKFEDLLTRYEKHEHSLARRETGEFVVSKTDEPLPLDCVYDKEALREMIEKAKRGLPLQYPCGFSWARSPEGENYWFNLAGRHLATSDIAKLENLLAMHEQFEDLLAKREKNELNTDKIVDMVNHPPHYANRRIEVIDIIEDNVGRAPDPVSGGLQWQVLKYVCRAWDKGDSLQDLKKAQWYLDRLIATIEEVSNEA